MAKIQLIRKHKPYAIYRWNPVNRGDDDVFFNYDDDHLFWAIYAPSFWLFYEAGYCELKINEP